METKICIVCKKGFEPKENRKPRKLNWGFCCSKKCGVTLSWETKRPGLLQKFLSQILIGDDCWEWTGPRFVRGYGQVGSKNTKDRTAHRRMWTLFHGPIFDGLWVLHRCDNPRCVRLGHLYIGTPRDNVRDCLLSVI